MGQPGMNDGYQEGLGGGFGGGSGPYGQDYNNQVIFEETNPFSDTVQLQLDVSTADVPATNVSTTNVHATTTRADEKDGV